MAELLQVFLDEVGFQTELREMDFASLGTLGRGRQAYVLNPIRNAPIRPSELGLRNTYTYEQYTDLPMASIAAEVTVNPEVVAGWVFPGVTSTGLSHWHLITSASD